MIADAIVAALAVACAAALYLTHLEAPRTLWLGALHDRNGHYAYAAGIALAIRDLDPVRLLQDLYNARVWPPLHGLLLAPVLAAFGPDFRLAGVVSAAAWAATMLGAFMIARRLLADAAAGLAAGAAAALWIAASPAMRAYGVDAMLESLGAALSVFALLGYIRVRERPADMRRWAQLGLVLTLLFFEKGNYWGLVIAALAAAAATVAPRAAWSWIRGEAAKHTLRGLIRGALWHPIGLAAAIVLCAVAAITLNGPTTVVLFGSSVSLHPPENLLTVGYALAFLRIAQIWYAGRAAFAAAVPAGARRLFAWHVLPIALSFLVPKRLAAFLWFVGPTNLPLGADAGLAAGARAYAIWFVEGYHAAPWMAALVVVLAGVGVLLRRRLAPGHEAVFALALAGALLTILHPQRQPRFIHSWVAAWWIAAALGLGALLAAAPLRAAARRAVAAALVCVLVVAQAEPLRRGAAAARLAENPAGRSDLDITDSYVGAIGGYRNVGVLSTVAAGALLQWTYYDRHRRRRGIESFRVPMVRGPEDVRNAARFWLATTAADALVLIDSRRPEHAIASLGWTPDNLSAAVEEVERQTRFRRIASWRPEAGGLVTVSLWEAVPR